VIFYKPITKPRLRKSGGQPTNIMQKNNKPTARNLTDSQKQSIVEDIQAYVADSSANKLAAASGVSSGTISQMINTEWAKISDAMWLKIKTFISGNGWQMLEQTDTVRDVVAACDAAKIQQRMVAISAYTGAGKTTALKYYRSQNPQNTHYICCNFLMKPKDLLHAIAKCFLAEPTKRDVDVLAELVKKVAEKNHYGSVILLDDFAKMGDGCYRMLQLIYDMTEYKLGIVVAGTETLSEYVTRSATKNKMGFREIKRRLGVMRGLPALSKDDIEGVCEVNGLTDEDRIKEITKHAKDFGTLKQMVMDSI
jgi:DNA transposition AAA+ family ATPase